MEIYGPDARDHGGIPGVGGGMASSRKREHRPVNKSKTQLFNTILSKLLAMLLGRKKFYAEYYSAETALNGTVLRLDLNFENKSISEEQAINIKVWRTV